MDPQMGTHVSFQGHQGAQVRGWVPPVAEEGGWAWTPAERGFVALSPGKPES